MSEESKSNVAVDTGAVDTGAAQSAPDATQETSKKSQAKEHLQTFQTVLAIVGGLGTLFVWCAANFYVGDVEVVPNHQYENLSVSVFDRKGQETTYHVPKFQLMPGMYHIEISADGTSKYPADVEVQFGQKRRLQVALVETANTQRTANNGSQAQPSSTNAQPQPAQADKNSAPHSPGTAQAPPLPENGSAQAATERTEPAKHNLTQNQPAAEQVETRSTAASNEVDNGEPSEDAQEAHHHWWQFRHKKVN